MPSTSHIVCGLLAALLSLAGAAADAGQPPIPSEFTLARAPVAEPLPALLFEPVAIPVPATTSKPGQASAGTLDAARGGADIISNEARLSGVVSNNSAAQVTTGANIIQSNSFANASGIPVVIQNSGANVLIQNATVINLQLK